MLYGGVLLYEQFKSGSIRPTISAFIVGIALFVVTLVMKEIEIIKDVNLRQMLLALIGFPFAIWLSMRWKLFERLLSIRPLQYLSEISMDIFLWHFPVQLLAVCIVNIFCITINYESVIFFGIYIVAVMLVANCSHIVIKKIESGKKRL